MKTKILFALISFSIIISCSRHANEMIDQNWKLVNVDGDNVKKVKDQMKADEANIKGVTDSELPSASISAPASIRSLTRFKFP